MLRCPSLKTGINLLQTLWSVQRVGGFSSDASVLAKTSNLLNTLTPVVAGLSAPYTVCQLGTTGHSLAFAEYGDLASPRVLIYHHGWPGSRVGALLTHQHASELGLRIIAVERPGYGQSPFLPYTLRTWADLIQELADQLKIPRFSLLGVSGSGAHAAACARFIPQERVASLNLVCPVGDLHSYSFRFLFWAANRFPQQAEMMWKYMTSNSKDDSYSFAKRFLATVDHAALAEDPTGALIMKASTMEALRPGAMGYSHDAGLIKNHWGFQLEDIKTKHVQLWHGLKDWSVPVRSSDLYKKIPSLVPHYFSNEGHLSITLRQMRTILQSIQATHDR